MLRSLRGPKFAVERRWGRAVMRAARSNGNSRSIPVIRDRRFRRLQRFDALRARRLVPTLIEGDRSDRRQANTK